MSGGATCCGNKTTHKETQKNKRPSSSALRPGGGGSHVTYSHGNVDVNAGLHVQALISKGCDDRIREEEEEEEKVSSLVSPFCVFATRA